MVKLMVPKSSAKIPYYGIVRCYQTLTVMFVCNFRYAVTLTIPSYAENYCENGLIGQTGDCICRPGYTGKLCDFEIVRSLPQDASTSAVYPSRRSEESGSGVANACIYGIPSINKTCICDYGYKGKICDIILTEGIGDSRREFSGDGETSGSGYGAIAYDSTIADGKEETTPLWSKSRLDKLRWKIIPRRLYSVPSKSPVSTEHIFDEQFAIVSYGINGTNSELGTAKERSGRGSNVYRFSFVPNNVGGKSRLELTTCYNEEEEVIKKYGEVPNEFEILVKTMCPISHLPLDHLHVYEYEIYIGKDDINFGAQYIITQWHGSADPTLLRDNNKCIAKVSAVDVHRLCSKGYCDQSDIFDDHNKFIGINYNQGGYPPLVMSLKQGHFMITAMSDERLFIEKGGCPKSGLASVRCPDHPRQQYNVLWTMPARSFQFDRWVKMKWEIKWSKYSTSGDTHTNPGILTSHALIRVWINDEMIVDWSGPCGRNDGNRIPYFKIGIYNPSGNTLPIRFSMRRYRHRHLPVHLHSSVKVKNSTGNLTLCARSKENVNRNTLKSLKKYRFLSLSSGSTRKCTLHAERDYLSFLLAARFGKMVIDRYTKQVISHLIYQLENQDLKINALRSDLNMYKSHLHI